MTGESSVEPQMEVGGGSDSGAGITIDAASTTTTKKKRDPSTYNLKGLNKRKRVYSRQQDKTKGSHDRKLSSSKHAPAATQLNVPGANSQQLLAAILSQQRHEGMLPPKPKALTKRGLQMQIKNQDKRISKLQKKLGVMERTVVHMRRRMSVLEAEKKDLLKRLQQEKKASNIVIEQSTAGARATMDEARDLLEEAMKVRSDAELRILKEQDRHHKKLEKVGVHNSRQIESESEKHRKEMAKQMAANEAELLIMKNKFDREKRRLEKQLAKCEEKMLKERNQWQKLSIQAQEKVEKSELLAHEEKKKSRKLIQQQYEKAAKKQREMQLYAADMKAMQFKLVDKLNEARGEKRKANKALERAQKLAKARLERVKETEDENVRLKEEFERLNELVKKQEQILAEYEVRQCSYIYKYYIFL